MRASEVVVCRLSCPAAYGTSVLLPGIEPVSPCIEKQILNLWTTKEVPGLTHSWCVDKTGVCACISEDQPHTTEYSDYGDFGSHIRKLTDAINLGLSNYMISHYEIHHEINFI